MESVHEGDVVTGVATRKIKGGLLVDIGVPVFLPASQVDIRRPADIGDYINRTIQSLVLKIDEMRRNIVVSRRALIEEERAVKKAQLLAELEIGQRRKGVVEEHRRLRRVRRSGRHRRPAAHHRHELGPHHPSLRDGRHRPGDRSPDPAHRLREGEDRAGPQAEDAQPVGAGAQQVSRRHAVQGHGGQRDELRRVRQAGRGHRRAGAYQRDVVDAADHPSQRVGPRRTTRSKSSC